MGRHRREAPSGKLRLLYPKSNPDKHKLYTIYYEYTWLKDTIQKSTQVKARIDDWNKDGNRGKGELRASFGSDYKRINSMLNDKLLHYDATLLEYAQKHPHRMCKEIIHSILHDAPLTRQDEGKDFVDYVESCLKSKLIKNKIGKSRYENGKSSLKIFREFLVSQSKGTYKPDSIYLGEVTISLIDAYIAYILFYDQKNREMLEDTIKNAIEGKSNKLFELFGLPYNANISPAEFLRIIEKEKMAN